MWSNPKLEDFVSAKGRCVCVTFGSMTEVANSFDIVGKVLEGIDTYAKEFCSNELLRVLLIYPAESSTLIARIKKQKHLSVFICKEAPHEQIFPKCHCVIHHGGSGTTARVLDCGLPSVIVPIMLWTDQPFWADRVENLGAGVHVPRGSGEFPSKVAAAVKYALHDISFSGLPIEQDGVSKAADTLMGL